MATGNCTDCGAFLGPKSQGGEWPLVSFRYQGFKYQMCPSDALTHRQLAYSAGDTVKYDIISRALVRAGVI